MWQEKTRELEINYLGLNNSDTLSKNIKALAQFSSKMYDRLNSMNARINQNTSYLQTSNSNIINNYHVEMPNSYTINNSPGRQDATVQAIARTNPLRIRNLQGVLNR